MSSSLSDSKSVCLLFIERPCLAAIGHFWQDTLVHNFFFFFFGLSEMGSCLSWSTNTQAQTNKTLHPHTQGQGRDQENDQAEEGKTTWQGRREPHRTGKQQTEDNGGHWQRATSCSEWTKPRSKVKVHSTNSIYWTALYIEANVWESINHV